VRRGSGHCEALGDALYGPYPSYASIANLLAAGTQGLQLSLLAPGWLHGCLGLWITLRRYPAMQRSKPLLIALVVAIPLAAAAGFVRMALAIAALPPAAPSPALLAAQQALAQWAISRCAHMSARLGWLSCSDGCALSLRADQAEARRRNTNFAAP
jgi:hypothetical protein